MDPTWAAWADEAVLIYRRGSEGKAEVEHLPRRTPAGLRYFVKLFRVPGALLLRSADGDRTLFEQVDTVRGLHRVPGWPEELAALPVHRVTALADGSFAGLPEDGRNVLLWKPGQGAHSHPLPPGFRARAVALDERGSLYAAGSIASDRLHPESRRQAFAASAGQDAGWHVDETDRRRSLWYRLFGRADTEYRTVAATGRHLVLSSELGDLGEETTQVFIRDPQMRWTSLTVRDDTLRAAVKTGDEEIAILFHRGNSILSENGRCRQIDLAPRLKRALLALDDPPPAGVRYEILDVDTSMKSMVVLVSIRAPGASGLVRTGEAILALGEEVDRVVHVQRAPAPEVISACF